MANVKVGDKFRVIVGHEGSCSNSSVHVRAPYDYLLVTCTNHDGSDISSHDIIKDGERIYSCSCYRLNNLVPFNNSLKNMNLKEKFALLLTPEPQKSFRKAGITNGDDMLTADGTTIFLTWLLQKNSVDFKKEVVDALVVDESK